jgi:hypothetical protein
MQPTLLTDKEKVEDTLHILALTSYRAYHLVKRCIEVYEASNGKPSDAQIGLIKGVQMFLIIQFSAFLDEWRTGFLKLKEEGIEVTRVEKMERIVKPAFDVIAEYPDIKTFRDTLLAHNSRIKVTKTKYENSYRGSLISGIVAPISISEFVLVATACLKITDIVVDEFKDYYIRPADFLTQYTLPNNNKAKTDAQCKKLNEDMDVAIKALQTL